MLNRQTLCVLALSCFMFPVHGADAAPQTLRLKTTDGLTIAADWHAPTGKLKGAIVALHMFKSKRSAWDPMLAPAAEAGFGVLTLDLRGHGQSAKQGKKNLAKRVRARDAALFNAMHLDVAAAVEWLNQEQKIGSERIILFGASVGCSVALDYGARNQTIGGAVLLTPGKKYLGVDSMAHITKWAGRPVLMVSSKEEADKGAIPLYEATPAPRGSLVMTLPQTQIHGTNMFGKVKKIESRLVQWAALRLPKDTPAKSAVPQPEAP
ncbi:MAG: alpha-beta hydrolase superfamily lysophospholipase [Myxococcota bacterium]|jgi:alpha-beta hydrolase superfamily lysophospholipase